MCSSWPTPCLRKKHTEICYTGHKIFVHAVKFDLANPIGLVVIYTIVFTVGDNKSNGLPLMNWIDQYSYVYIKLLFESKSWFNLSWQMLYFFWQICDTFLSKCYKVWILDTQKLCSTQNLSYLPWKMSHSQKKCNIHHNILNIHRCSMLEPGWTKPWLRLKHRLQTFWKSNFWDGWSCEDYT